MSSIRSILTVAVVLGALAAAAAPAAYANPTRQQADSIMSKDYKSFLAHKRGAPAPFDWSSDGCSSPTPRSLQNLFNGPCQQHDFGYRNYGRGLRLGSNEGVRDWIDGRLLTEMRRVCNANFSQWWQQANRGTCHSQAGGIWSAVRHGGRGAFYHG